MNILLLRQYNPFIEVGASANRFRGLIDGLRKLGHNVDVAVVGGFVSPKEKLKSDNSVVYLSKANHYSYWQSRLNIYIFDKLHNLFAVKRYKSLDLASYDVIWLTNSAFVLNMYFKSKVQHKAKTFIELNEFNDIYMERGNSGNFLQRLKGGKSSICFVDSVKKIDLFGVMTNMLLRHYRSMANPDAKFLHLPMTVDLERFNDVLETNKYSKPYIAFTGTMNNAKDGVDILIKSFAKVADKYPSIHLYLAGFYHYDVPAQDELIKQNKLENRIHRLGVLSRDQIPSFVSNAVVLALSRPDSHQAQGGFPTKLGEYLATGNPVCVTKVGEIPDYLEDNVSAFMAEPGDVDSFADMLDRALSNPEKAAQVGLAGRKVAEENFSSELQAKRLAEFLEENIRE